MLLNPLIKKQTFGGLDYYLPGSSCQYWLDAKVCQRCVVKNQTNLNFPICVSVTAELGGNFTENYRRAYV